MSGAEGIQLEPRDAKQRLPGVAARYAFAVACIALALLARLMLDPLFHDSAPFFTFVVAVTAVAWFGGFWPALLSSVLGFLAANWFFIFPRGSLRIDSAGDAMNAGSYFTVALAITVFSHVMHKARGQALSRQQELEREIADRKRAEEELARLARFPSENPGPVLRLGMDGTVLYANEASRLLAGEGGYNAGDTAPDFLWSAVEKARAAQTPTEVDVQQNGRTWSLFIVPIPDSGYVNLYAKDVTEHRRAEQVHEAQLARLAALTRVSEQILAATTVEALLQQIVDAARELVDACIAVSGHGYQDGQFRIGRASRAEQSPPCPSSEAFTVERGGLYMTLIEGAPSLRLTEAEMLAHPRWRGLPPGHVPLRGLLGARLVNARGAVNGLIMVSNKRSGEFTADDESLLGQLAAVASLALQQVEARVEAVNQRNRLEAVLESLPVGMAILDAQGGTVRANSAFESIWGAPRPPTREVSDYAKFKAWWVESGRPVQPEEWASAQAVQHGRTVVGQMAKIETFDGAHRFVLNSAAPVRDAAGAITGCVVAIQDITEVKQAEERIAELYAQARQELMLRWQVEQELRRSNEDLSQFAFVISHDLRSPLNAVTSFARQLKEDYQHKLGEQADTYLSFLAGATDRMRRLISDLLAYSRVAGDGAGQTALASGEEALRSAELNLQEKIRETKAVITHDPLPDVMANPTLLAQLFQNLLENALKFRGEEAPLIQISVGQREEEWFFSVSDNGIGIDPEHLEQVFRIFKRLHGDRYEGTGIGLAICKKIVERHGGRLWVESGFGKGARFCFTLPVRS